MFEAKRCRFCGKPLAKRDGEDAHDWKERKSCGRSCHTAWRNSKPIWHTFAELAETVDSGCIEWSGHRDPKGYGRFASHSGEILAHRIAYQMHFGQITDGQYVLHRCDNPRCVNPHHLFLGTNQENMDDMVRKGRSSKRHGIANPNYRHGRNCTAQKERANG